MIPTRRSKKKNTYKIFLQLSKKKKLKKINRENKDKKIIEVESVLR